MVVEIMDQYYLKSLEAIEIPNAIDLCGRHVGKGMYTEHFLKNVICKENHFFYLIYHESQVIGYFYCLHMPLHDISQIDGLDNRLFHAISGDEDIIGICRSIGIDDQYRGSKLSDYVLQYFTGFLFSKVGVQAIFIPAWVKGGYVPAKRLLEENYYQYLCYLDKPWINNSELKCPYCNRRHCICDAAIYYMKEEDFDGRTTEKV